MSTEWIFWRPIKIHDRSGKEDFRESYTAGDPLVKAQLHSDHDHDSRSSIKLQAHKFSRYYRFKKYQRASEVSATWGFTGNRSGKRYVHLFNLGKESYHSFDRANNRTAQFMYTRWPNNLSNIGVSSERLDWRTPLDERPVGYVNSVLTAVSASRIHRAVSRKVLLYSKDREMCGRYVQPRLDHFTSED
jgi:hypothetical protein